MNLLNGIHIVALANNIPGPAAAWRLTEWGANVTKIESHQGDPLQGACPKWYQKLHANQTILTLDLKQQGDFATLIHLLSSTDVFVTALRPQSLKKLSLDWPSLHRQFSTLCHISITGYPPPDDSLPAHDLTCQAQAGLLCPPELPKLLIADLASVDRIVSAVLAALFFREKTGTATHTSISLFESTQLFQNALREHLTTPTGLLGGQSPAYHLYPTASGWIALAALEPVFWERVTLACGIHHPSYNDLKKFFSTRSAQAWEKWACEKDIPLVAVKNLGDIHET